MNVALCYTIFPSVLSIMATFLLFVTGHPIMGQNFDDDSLKTLVLDSLVIRYVKSTAVIDGFKKGDINNPPKWIHDLGSTDLISGTYEG